MRTHIIYPRFISRRLLIAAICLATMIAHQWAQAAVVDPLANGPVSTEPSNDAPVPKPMTRAVAASAKASRHLVSSANYQANTPPPAAGDGAQALPAPAGAAAEQRDPCYAAPHRPLNQLGISIAAPEGKLPTDLAAPCWVQINQTTSAARCWSVFSYNWEATCFYHNPLYFEEINLERYGYQCGDRCCCCSCGYECCLQPAASAAHFFGTIPALPYYIAADCPGECVYTLGHYRPGSCNPRRCHWPPCDPIAAASAGGIWTGLIFAIP